MPAPISFSNSHQKVQDTFGAVEIVNDPVIAHSYAVGVHSLHSVVWVVVQRQSQTVNAGLDSGLNGGWQSEKASIEIPRIDLQRGAH